MITPCKGCTKREVGCHGKCEDYKTFKNEMTAVNKKRKAVTHLEVLSIPRYIRKIEGFPWQ